MEDAPAAIGHRIAPLDAESKYKAKNFIDTVVYRGGDALSGWAKSLIDSLGQGAWLVGLVGAMCAAIWGVLGWLLGVRTDRDGGDRQTGSPARLRRATGRST
ncbi:hypothetical protein OMR07_19630 [Methylobacterium organophilum]|nr:hypothetical protein [Methylobacterium organophilum]